MRKRILLLLALSGLLPAQAGAQQAIPAASPATPKAIAAPAAPTAAQPAAAPGLSQSKFVGLLYAEISRRTPSETEAGAGEVEASFHIAANGKVDKVTIVRSTSPAHADIVRKVLTDLQGPPPPGGPDDITQIFKFH